MSDKPWIKQRQDEMRLSEVADMLGVCLKTVRGLIARGVLRWTEPEKPGDRRAMLRSHVEEVGRTLGLPRRAGASRTRRIGPSKEAGG